MNSKLKKELVARTNAVNSVSESEDVLLSIIEFMNSSADRGVYFATYSTDSIPLKVLILVVTRLEDSGFTVYTDLNSHKMVISW